MFKIIIAFVSLCSTQLLAQGVPPLADVDGVVVHNIASTSAFFLGAGEWSDCEPTLSIRERCQLNGAYAVVGSQRIALPEGVYFAPNSHSRLHSYYLHGEMAIGGRVLPIVVSMLVYPDGKRRGYIRVPELGMTEQVIAN